MFKSKIFFSVFFIFSLILTLNFVLAECPLPATAYGAEFGEWTKDIDAAKELAASVNNYFMIYWGSSNCGYCCTSQSKLFNTQPFYNWAKTNKIPLVYANVDTTNSWTTLIRSDYQIHEAVKFPIVVFVDGKTNNRIKYFRAYNQTLTTFTSLAPAPRACIPLTEICDGIDNDCDTQIDEHPTQEICDGIDNDCDTQIDEEVGLFYYRDTDGDGFGLASMSIQACSAPTGYSAYNSDCDDSSFAIKPNAVETCDGIDNDCDTQIDEGFDCQKESANCNSDCSFATRRTNSCIGSIPQNSSLNSSDDKYLERWNGTIWRTVDNNTFRHSILTKDCTWKCNTGYVYVSSSNTCETNMIQANCPGTIDDNSEWNDNGNNGTFSYPRGTMIPTKTVKYSLTPGDCVWKCKEEFHKEGSVCVSDEKLIPCTIPTNTLPENAKWNSPLEQNFKQTWTNNAWTPTTKNAYYSENTNECAYSCLELTKTCQPDPTTYCGIGQKDCNKGYWTTCAPTQANKCTTNQYCENEYCTFCSQGTKNCDSNLLNGCETNIQIDNNNCGYCGNKCDTSETCIEGMCIKENIDVNLCEDAFCGPNSSCSPQTGNCICITGFYNCDESESSSSSPESNGCESQTACVVEPECTLDIDCGLGEECKDNECEKIIQKPADYCETDLECIDTSSCVGSKCQPIVCGNGFVIRNRSCACEGNICNNVCYSTQGVCCRNNWNEGINSCEFETESIAIIVDASKDTEAIDLLEEAKNSINTGEITKGQAQAITAELKALIETKNQTQYNEKYQEILTAIQEEEYDTAIENALEIKEKIIQDEQNFNFLVTVVVLVLVIVGIIIGATKILANKKDNPEIIKK